MKKVIITMLIGFSLSILKAQSKQTKSFEVNAYEFLGDNFNKGPKPLCNSFTVTITTRSINIGERYDLKVINSKYNREMGYSTYLVEDWSAKNQISYVIIAVDSYGENYIQIHDKDEDGDLKYEGGIMFKQWDYVSNYDLWRSQRSVF